MYPAGPSWDDLIEVPIQERDTATLINNIATLENKITLNGKKREAKKETENKQERYLTLQPWKIQSHKMEKKREAKKETKNKQERYLTLRSLCKACPTRILSLIISATFF